MARDAKKMRDELFETLFQEEGILLSELMNYLKPYIEIWNKLHILLKKSVENFDQFSSLDTIKIIDNKYLIIKKNIWGYLIVDINSKKVLKKEDIIGLFSEQFFIDNFKEEKTNLQAQYLKFYHFSDFKDDVQPLIDLYNNNQKVFEAPTKIFYKNNIDEAYVYLSINLIDGNIQIGFQTPDQFLYEQLFIKQDLTPFGMQDATHKIGAERIREMFSKVKDIKVPIRCIPSGILKMLNIKCDIDEKSKEKTINLVKEKSQN